MGRKRMARWTPEEDAVVLSCHSVGEALQQMDRLPGRSRNAIRHHWKHLSPQSLPRDGKGLGRRPMTPDEERVAQIFAMIRRLVVERGEPVNVTDILEALRYRRWREIGPLSEVSHGITAWHRR